MPELTAANVDDGWRGLLAELLHSGRTFASRAGKTREILGFSFQLINPEHGWLWNSRRQASARYAAAELLWYLSGSNDGAMISAYAPSYTKFLEANGTAHGAYGERLRNQGLDQLRLAISMLMDAPHSRQVVLDIWRPEDLQVAAEGECKDLPCTLNLQLLLRNDRLTMVTTMRSNDAWLGFPYDVWCFTSIQRLIAGAIGCKLGDYFHNVGSMHLYDKNAEAAMEARDTIDPPCPPRRYKRWPIDGTTLIEHVNQAASEEAYTRQNGEPLARSALPKESLLRECVLLCKTKWMKDVKDGFVHGEEGRLLKL